MIEKKGKNIDLGDIVRYISNQTLVVDDGGESYENKIPEEFVREILERFRVALAEGIAQDGRVEIRRFAVFSFHENRLSVRFSKSFTKLLHEITPNYN